MKIGYGRVSTSGQSLEAQIDALRSAGCEKIFSEKQSGKTRKRPEFEKLIAQLRAGDVLIVTKLDRLARSIKDLVSIMADLEELGAGFKSLGENVDLSTPAGRMTMRMFGVVAEFEREIILERTQEGVRRAIAQGRMPGRRKALDALQAKEVIERVERGDLVISDVAKIYKVSPSTVHRVMRKHREGERAV